MTDATAGRPTPLSRHGLRRAAGGVRRRLVGLERGLNVRGLRTEVARLRATVEQLQASEFVPPGHFYSAIPDRTEVQSRYDALSRRDPGAIAGVDLRLARQWALLEHLAPMVDSVPFGDRPKPGLRYGFDNGAYSYGDATMLHLMLRLLAPQQVIEVGSGHSSACTLDTVDRFLGGRTRLTFIEPYDELLRSLITSEDEERVSILCTPVQDVDVEVFEALRDGDLLFIDSTHVSKVGSDVNFLFFDVLPQLQPGVVVHIHDVFPGFEYPLDWIEEGRAWQEDYLLRAFLQFNDAFEVLFWPALLYRLDPERVAAIAPAMRRNSGASIYLRRSGGRPLLQH